jgi:predicted dehydrogenase
MIGAAEGGLPMHDLSRRDFLKTAAAGSVGASLPSISILEARTRPEQTPREVPPGDRLRIALIGAGGQGMGDTRTALRVPGVDLVAVSDIYDGRLARAKELWGSQVFTTRDYREVLARPDVNAVIVATPDHWHARIAADAMNAGKDVYVEKPMVHAIEEGPGLAETARRTNRILQVGSQRVSSILYAKARDLYRSGIIGELNMVEAWINRNSAIGAWQYTIPPDASPQTIDWDRFIGQAPRHPFDPVRLFRWRNYRDYGTGIPGDLFVHLFSGIHYVLDSTGPTRVMATGGLRYWKDGRDVPDVMLALYDYPATHSHPAFTLSLKVNFAEGGGEDQGFRFVGPEGVLTIGGPGVTVARHPRPKEPGYTIGTFPMAMQQKILEDYRAKYPAVSEVQPSNQEVYAPPDGYSDSYDHFVTFFTGVRTRTPVIEDAVFGFRAAAPALLTNESYFEQRPMGWDPDAMKRRTPAADKTPAGVEP